MLYDVVKPILGDNPTDKEREEYEREYKNFENLLNSKINTDIVVFSSADGREENAIGLPYLNDRKYAYIDEKGNIIEETKSVYFIQVAEFESASVVLEHEGTGSRYTIPYGAGAEAFLDIR